MSDILVLATDGRVRDEPLSFSLSALCRASGAHPDLVLALIGEGLLAPTGPGPQAWCFDGDALPRTRRARRLVRDFGLDLVALGLVMDLLGEVERLRARLRRP